MAEQSQYDKLDVQLLGISASNPFSQKTFAASLNLPYPLLSDYPDLTTIRQYDMLQHIGESKRPVAKGAFLLIDKQGVLRNIWMATPGEIFPNDLILEAVQEIEKRS